MTAPETDQPAENDAPEASAVEAAPEADVEVTDPHDVPEVVAEAPVSPPAPEPSVPEGSVMFHGTGHLTLQDDEGIWAEARDGVAVLAADVADRFRAVADHYGFTEQK